MTGCPGRFDRISPRGWLPRLPTQPQLTYAAFASTSGIFSPRLNFPLLDLRRAFPRCGSQTRCSRRALGRRRSPAKGTDRALAGAEGVWWSPAAWATASACTGEGLLPVIRAVD